MKKEINLEELSLNQQTTDLPKKYLCVDLDCLFDTRLPMACLLDPYGMNRMLENKKYHNRKKDVLGNIPEITFKQIYQTRTKHILEIAKPTPMIDFVTEAYADMAYDVRRIAYDFDVGIFINMFPYDLNQSELDTFKLLFKRLYKDINIEFINKSIADLTPSFLKKHIGVLIKYDTLFWLEYHTSMLNIFQNHIFGITLIAPMLGMGPILKKDINPEHFKTLRKHNSKVASIEFLPIDLFSYTDKILDIDKIINSE